MGNHSSPLRGNLDSSIRGRPGDPIIEGGRPERDAGIWAIPQQDDSLARWSTAVNMRRIFIVLLTFLLLVMIYSVANLYIVVSQDYDASMTALKVAGFLMVVVCLAGSGYAVLITRYSHRPRGKGKN